jgi:predicted outer membrane protein
MLAACAREAPPPAGSQPRPTSRPPTSQPRPLPVTSYVATAASIDLYNVRACELALERGNPRSRDYASRLMADHRGTASQLSFAGRRLNLLPSAQMAPAHQALIDALAASGDFDATFRRQQVDLHLSSQRMHAAFAARGDSPTLRPVAANAATVEARHLEAARGL